MRIEIPPRLIATLIAMAIPVVLFWLGGYDFDQRGEAAVGLALLVLVAGGFAAFVP